MSTATNKAIPTWEEVKTIASQKKYHWKWGWVIGRSISGPTSFTPETAQALTTINNGHSSGYLTLFHISYGCNWKVNTNTNETSPIFIYPIYSCILTECQGQHGIVYIPDIEFYYNSSLIKLSSITLSLGSLAFKDLRMTMTPAVRVTFDTDGMIFWEAQQITIV